MNINIRFATEQDLPAILEIYNEIIVNTTAVYSYQPHTIDMRREWFRSRRENGYPVFVAEEGERILGFASFGQFRTWQAYKYSVEHSVHVAADSRGMGVGKLLMQALIKEAKEMQLHTIIGGIDADNTNSIRFHRKFGFVEVAHFKQVGYKFGRWLDLVFMQLILETPQSLTEE